MLKSEANPPRATIVGAAMHGTQPRNRINGSAGWNRIARRSTNIMPASIGTG
jgi:hypothetical protein